MPTISSSVKLNPGARSWNLAIIGLVYVSLYCWKLYCCTLDILCTASESPHLLLCFPAHRYDGFRCSWTGHR
ncbi:unnamed protein product [Periconia digitata]|uniref:Uncharacterized protein n=1 Tax=Periconia digitata TaxID=1303443 RepID=A0A9W4XLA8_9PLEO|nr:unnamed protein product [Periconia digitata]